MGKFLEKVDSGHKGIKQADIVFADLSYQYFGWLKKIQDEKMIKHELPDLQNYRIIFFAKKILDFSGFYLDIDPRLWKVIRELNHKHSFSVYPSKK